MSGQINGREFDWYRYLIDAFLVEFDQWESPACHDISHYLTLFNRGRLPSAFRTAGHAFLHIGYDLPRVLANSMTTPPFDQIPRSRLRTLFLWPAPMFRQVFLEQIKDGMFGALARPFGYVKPLEILAYWILALRSVAWIHGEILADAPVGQRTSLEENLARSLLKAGLEARRASWLSGVPKLDNSRLFQLAWMPSTSIATSRERLQLLEAAVLTIGGVLFASHEYYRFAAERIRLLGEGFSAEASKAMASGEFPLDPPSVVY